MRGLFLILFAVGLATANVFNGVDNTGWNPPDSAISVGTTEAFAVVNGGMVYLDKSGNTLGKTTLRQFYGSNTFIYDPRAFYDHYSNRHFIVCAENIRAPSSIRIAVSKRSVDVTLASTDWYFYKIDVDEVTGWCDYPTAGYSEKLVGVSCNMFSDPSYPSISWLFKRSELISGTLIHSKKINNDRNGSPMYTLQLSIGNSNGLYGATTMTSRTVTVVKFNEELFSGTRFAQDYTYTYYDISVTQYFGGSQKLNQPNGIDILGSGTRMMNLFGLGGKLYATHNANTYTDNFPVVRVYEISTTPVGLIKEYTIALPDKSLLYPCVIANKAGIIIVSSNSGSSTQTFGIDLFYGNSQQDFSGLNFYQSPESRANTRFGDYSSCALDPTDGLTAWMHHPTVATSTTWKSKIVSYRPPSNVINCVPDCINGICNNGVCICNAGYTGPSCSTELCLNGCANGICNNGVCNCDLGYTGISCETPNCVPGCQSGTCVINQGLPECVCDTGYTGDHCQIEILNCDHGTFTLNSDTGLCYCDPNYQGTLCDTIILNCVFGNYSITDNACICQPNYTGKHCDEYYIPCSVTCQNGICNHTTGLCDCYQNYIGIDCGQFFLECPSNCNNGVCDHNSGNCVCNSGFTGQFCETKICVCGNGGQCINDSCVCNLGYTGEFCDTCDINTYSEDCLVCPPCVHGSCDNITGLCNCDIGWEGTLCDEIDCEYYCQNGECQFTGINEETCVCSPGYTGEYCDIPANCTLECLNGECIFDIHGGESCNCLTGYTGPLCDILILECIHGVFNDSTGVCICNQGYTGEYCQTEILDCQNGIFNDSTGVCICNQGYSGSLCQFRILNCQHGVFNERCICDPGYTGNLCQYKILDCKHGVYYLAGQSCICDTGYKGTLCDILDINCNNGHYNETISACVCDDNFTGQYCQNIIDSDNSTSIPIPCGNGTLSDNGVCMCDPGYSGLYCNETILSNCLHGTPTREGLIPSRCICDPGFIGINCQHSLYLGYPCYPGCQYGNCYYYGPSNYQCKCFTNYIGQYCEECAGTDRYSYQCRKCPYCRAGSTCDSGIYGNGECKCNKLKLRKATD